MTEQARSEQRRDARVTINKEFSSFDAFVDEYVTNVSRSGAFVKSAEPLPVGTQINLRFTVITDELVSIEGIGEVVRVEHDPPGMGVVFTQVDQHSQQLLERLIVGRRR